MADNQIRELNIDEIRAYNNDLKQYQGKAAQMQVELDYCTKELTRICNELSVELNICVTPDNIRDIYNDRVEKSLDTLRTGRDILNRIKQEEQSVGQVTQQDYSVQPNQAQYNQSQFNQGQFNNQAQMFNNQAQVFNGQQAQTQNQAQMGVGWANLMPQGQQPQGQQPQGQQVQGQQVQGQQVQGQSSGGKIVLEPISSIPHMGGGTIEI